MFAAIRSGAGWLAIGTALASSGCSGLALPLPGFGPADLPPAMDPRMVQASDPKNTERPEFFVQWKPSGLPGLTRRPKIDPETPLPEYPPSAVRKEETGITSLESCLTAEGRLVDIQLAKSSGSRVLDEATVAWAKTAKYLPAEFNGEAFAICGYKFDYEWRVEVE
jgi:periplasmic protein TonB